MSFFWSQIDGLGRQVTNIIDYTIEVLMMAYLSIRAAIVDQAQGFREILSVISAQIYFTGWQAMPLISVLALTTGGLVILQSSTNLSMIGGTGMIGDLMVVIILREVGPLLTALVVIARSGTAVATDVGNMRANREIEALESMGINPLSFIVFPRLVGGVISVICLAFYFIAIAFFGGYLLTSLIHDIPLRYYHASLSQAISISDIILFFAKVTFSGLIIFIVSCYQGFSVKKSPTEVPVATTQAVVRSIIYVIVFNMSVTVLFYLNQLSRLGVL